MTGLKTTDKRNPNHTPDMLKEPHAELGTKAKRLNEVLVAGTRGQWPQALASLGIAVSPRRRDIDESRITVLTRHMDCNAWACAVYYPLETEVLESDA